MAQACFAQAKAAGTVSSLTEAIASKYLQGCSNIRQSISSNVEIFGLTSSVDSTSNYDRLHLRLQVTALHRRAPNEGSWGKQGSTDLSSFQSETWLSNKSSRDIAESDPLWEQIGAGLRIVYAAGVYLVMAISGQAICHFAGLDNSGGCEMCPNMAIQGLGFAIPPMLVLLFILDDEVVKKSPAARAIRDVEDEELMTFFVGMTAWQLLFVIAMDAIAEELFFRIAIQGGIVHMLLSDGKIFEPSTGIAAVTGVFPFFAPFARGLAAVLTGSIQFVTSFPQDPAYVITRVHQNHSSPREVKKSFAAWYERRQLRKIYSPLLDSLLALYLGTEFLQTGNIFAPIITHTVYSTVVVGNGLRRIHDQREKLRQRTQRFWERERVSSDLLPRVEK